MTDLLSGRSFLVDTGAEESVYPARLTDRKGTRGANLAAANGSAIHTYGKRTLPLKFNKNKCLSQEFWIADVTQPILGADFFSQHRLAVDVTNKRLITLDGNCIIQARNTNEGRPGIHKVHSKFEAILEEFPDLLVPAFETNKHGVKHYIPTTGPPIHARARRLDLEKFTAAKKEFDEMEHLGIVRRSSSAWSSPLHMVKKANGEWRPCGDYRRLNHATKDDRYPLPHIQDLNANLSGKSIFSKIDLVRGYNQIPVSEQDVPKTAVITPFGLYEFLKMPFGLKNAAQAFQRLMDGILHNLDCCFVYLDDILVSSSTPESHIVDLRKVFSLLSTNGLVVNVKKCVFGQTSIQFLGHLISPKGIQPLSGKIHAIKDFPTPADRKSLERFLGMMNFYHRFIPRLASQLIPLTEALKGKSKQLTWSSECQSAFQSAKELLAKAVMLHHPQNDATTKLSVDASDFAIGAELSQQQHGLWKPIAFFSRKLSPTQSRYSTFDRELLAIHSAVKHFRYFIEGRPFFIITDHKPLTHAMASAADRSPRQERQLSFIAEFTTDIRYLQGSENVVPDALSRAPPVDSEPLISSVSHVPVIDFTMFAHSQRQDQNIQELRNQPGSLILEEVSIHGVKTLCDISTGHPRPVVPPSWTKTIFDTFHSLCHPGPKPTTRTISARYIWPGLKKDVRNMVKTCHACQASKIGRHTKAPLKSFKPPDRRFGDIHVDLVGPLPSSENCVYLLTIVDRFTRWPEAIPLSNAEAVTCARALLRTWISRFGIPDSITSDRGPQFTSELWRQLNRVLGVIPKNTTAYHPQSNGIVERFHRSLKAALKARLTGPCWMDELPIVLLGIRTTWKEDLDAAPVLYTYGTNLRVPGDFLPPPYVDKTVPDNIFLQNLQDNLRKLSPPLPMHHGMTSSYIPRDLHDAQHVYVRHDAHRGPLVRPYDGPFPVVAKSDKYFDVVREGKTIRVSIDRLKPAYSQPARPQPVSSQQRPEPCPMPDRNEPLHDCDASTVDDIQHMSSKIQPQLIETRSGRTIVKPMRYRN